MDTFAKVFLDGDAVVAIDYLLSPKLNAIWNCWNGLVAQLQVEFTVRGVGRVEAAPAALGLKVEIEFGPNIKKMFPHPGIRF